MTGTTLFDLIWGTLFGFLVDFLLAMFVGTGG